MNIDKVELQELVNKSLIPSVVKHFDEAGGQAIRTLTAALRGLFDNVEESTCRDRIIVFQAIREDIVVFPNKTIIDFRELLPLVENGFILQIHASGEKRIINERDIELETLSKSAIVYRYEKGAECFIINGNEFPIPNVYPGPHSIFSFPTFADLKDALHYYAREQIYTSKCRIFSQCWFDENHLFLKIKPESTMRRSLEQFLSATLRGNAEVRPEQNVDETHPVDIRVLFRLSNRVALIEIKWLGRSIKEDGTPGTEYTESRALGGANQLADYLDKYRISDPGTVGIGYLVVFDARRKFLRFKDGTIPIEDALGYESNEINYDPQHHILRGDFEEPLRMFCRPSFL